MNERLLDILLQIFALVAREGGLQAVETEVVRTFLDQQLSEDQTRKHLSKFEAYVASDLPGVADLEPLCRPLNQELTLQQKFFIMVRLLELIQADDYVSVDENKAFETVAKAFNISAKDSQPLFEFIITRTPRQLLLQNMLIISSSKGSLRGKHRMEENLVGYIAVMHLEDPDLYLLRYIGNGEAYINGQALLPGVVYLLGSGSVIRAPRIQPIYFSDVLAYFWAPKHEQVIDFKALGVGYKFGGGQVGLHPVELEEGSGRLVAIMGASGSGKSTLLNVLNGNLKPTQGQVLINGIDLHTAKDQLQGVIGYVAQDDLLMEELTVFENLYYNARLSFGRMKKLELSKLVLKTLDSLGLLEIKNLKVGSPLNKKISGGQRKRLNIALELIREPSVLFVDEPTSGLSSRDSENVVDLLKELSLRGKLVFVVIHQPSSDIYKLFDRLLLLDKGGYPIYYGNPLESIRYFRTQMGFVDEDQVECHTCGNVNPEQIFTIVETRLVDETGNLTATRKFPPQKWWERYSASKEALKQQSAAAETATHLAPETNLKLPGRLLQYGVYLKRDWLQKVRNKSYLAINLLEAPLLALLLAFILRFRGSGEAAYSFFDNVNLPAFLLTGVIVGLFIGLTVSAEEILRDRKIRKREAFLSLSRHSYLLAKVTILVGLSALQMLLFVLVGNGVTGIEGMSLPYWLMLFSLAVFGNLLGLNISSAFDNAVTIYILVPILLIPQLVLSGALVNFAKLNPDISSADKVPIIGQIMASRWAYEGLAVQQFTGNGYEKLFYSIDQKLSEADYKVNFWLPALQTKLDYASNHPPTDPVRDGGLQLVGRELQAELRQFDSKQELPVGLISGTATQSAIDETEVLLEKLKVYYRNQAAQARKERDTAYSKLMVEGQDVEQLKRKYQNDAMTDLVTNRQESEKIREVNGRLLELTDPVYRNPAPALISTDAHFYAPKKYLLGRLVPTYQFNLMILWAMTLLLYATLYTDALGRAVRLVGRSRQSGE